MNPSPRLVVGLSVPHIFMHGLKMDFIVPIRLKLHLYLSPEYYSGNLTYSEDGDLSGYGFHGGARYVFWNETKKSKERNSAFAHLSFGYNHFRIEGEDKIWVERTLNNQTVLVKETAPVFKEYNRLSMDYLLGMIWKTPIGFYYEWNFGLSLRRVNSKFTENYIPSYANDEFSWSYGSAGVSPMMGLRLGFMVD